MTAWKSFTNQKQWKAYLQNLLKTREGALLKAILIIYENQTHEEKCAGESVEDNGIGFNKFDAITMSEIAKKLKNGQGISPKEIALAKITMPKYWKQLMRVCKINIEKEKQINELYEQAMQSIANKEEIQNIRDEEIRQCLEEGKACSFGICDECPVTNFRSDKDGE